MRYFCVNSITLVYMLCVASLATATSKYQSCEEMFTEEIPNEEISLILTNNNQLGVIETTHAIIDDYKQATVSIYNSLKQGKVINPDDFVSFLKNEFSIKFDSFYREEIKDWFDPIHEYYQKLRSNDPEYENETDFYRDISNRLRNVSRLKSLQVSSYLSLVDDRDEIKHIISYYALQANALHKKPKILYNGVHITLRSCIEATLSQPSKTQTASSQTLSMQERLTQDFLTKNRNFALLNKPENREFLPPSYMTGQDNFFNAKFLTTRVFIHDLIIAEFFQMDFEKHTQTQALLSSRFKILDPEQLINIDGISIKFTKVLELLLNFDISVENIAQYLNDMYALSDYEVLVHPRKLIRFLKDQGLISEQRYNEERAHVIDIEFPQGHVVQPYTPSLIVSAIRYLITRNLHKPAEFYASQLPEQTLSKTLVRDRPLKFFITQLGLENESQFIFLVYKTNLHLESGLPNWLSDKINEFGQIMTPLITSNSVYIDKNNRSELDELIQFVAEYSLAEITQVKHIYNWFVTQISQQRTYYKTLNLQLYRKFIEKVRKHPQGYQIIDALEEDYKAHEDLSARTYRGSPANRRVISLSRAKELLELYGDTGRLPKVTTERTLYMYVAQRVNAYKNGSQDLYLEFVEHVQEVGNTNPELAIFVEPTIFLLDEFATTPLRSRYRH